MSGKLFLKNHLPVILLNLLGALALSLFLLAVGNDIQTILFILAAWVLVLALYLAAGYVSRKKRLEKLLEMATQLKERYLLPEVMPVPDQAEEQVYYQLLKLAGKSMLERIGEVERERGEYRTYIEQWVHEVKTPITALKLLCENNRSPFSREVLAELENINRCAEQARGSVLPQRRQEAGQRQRAQQIQQDSRQRVFEKQFPAHMVYPCRCLGVIKSVRPRLASFSRMRVMLTLRALSST